MKTENEINEIIFFHLIMMVYYYEINNLSKYCLHKNKLKQFCIVYKIEYSILNKYYDSIFKPELKSMQLCFNYSFGKSI